MRVAVELTRTPEGQLAGEVRFADGTGGTFTGLLELLGLLETLDLDRDISAPTTDRRAPGTP